MDKSLGDHKQDKGMWLNWNQFPETSHCPTEKHRVWANYSRIEDLAQVLSFSFLKIQFGGHSFKKRSHYLKLDLLP